jgi:hypothetical protein
MTAADVLGAFMPGQASAESGAVIGDELRQPALWCDFDQCINRFADPAALGEADVRQRATSAGWRQDALGRLACPQCQQSNPAFRITGAVVPAEPLEAVAAPPDHVAGLAPAPAAELPPEPAEQPDTDWPAITGPLRLTMPAAETDGWRARLRRRESGRHRQTY